MNLVDTIRSTVQHNIQDRDQIIDLSAEYAEECADLNARMRQVAELLKAGLRGEAMAIADAEPQVLDRFAELDFPESGEWYGLVLEMGLEPPPPLLQDVAEEIDQAYADQGSLEKLLMRHRLLALRRAPLAIRIENLRHMLAKQPEHPLWENDLRDYENARIKEIVNEAKTAKGKGNVQALEMLTEEINSDWSIGISNQLKKSISRSAQELYAEKAREQIADLNVQLNQCLAEFDVENGNRIRAEWNQQQTIANLPIDHPLTSDVAEVFAWLDDELVHAEEDMRYQAAFRNLEASLDDRLPFEQIEQRFYTVKRFQQEIPPVLETRYAEHHRLHAVKGQRKFMAVVGASVIAILLVAGGIYYVISSIRYSAQKSDSLASIKQAVEDEDWNRAYKVYTGLPASLAAEPAIKELGVKAETEVSNENARTKNLAAIMSQLSNAAMDPPPNSLIDQANEIASTDNEKQAIRIVENEVKGVQQKLLQERNDVFLGKLRAQSDRLVKVEEIEDKAKAVQDFRQVFDALAELETSSKGSRFGYDLVSNSLLNQIPTLKNRITLLVTDYEQLLRIERGLESIENQIGDPNRFEATIAEFSETFPESNYNRDFQSSLTELSFHNGWQAWNQFIASSGIERLNRFSAKEASELQNKLTQIELKYPRYSDRVQTEKLKVYLASIIEKSDPELIRDLKDKVESFAMTKLWVLTETDARNRVYFTPFEPKIENGKAIIQYYKSVPPHAAAPTSRWVVEKPDTAFRAPHGILAAELKATLDKLSLNGFDATMLSCIEICFSPVKGDRQPDLIVRAQLLSQTIDDAISGNPKFGKYFGDMAKSLDAYQLNSRDNDWVKFDKTKPDSTRNALKSFFGSNMRNVDFSAIRRELSETKPNIQVDQRGDLEWVACFLQADDGTWKVISKDSLSDKEELYCLVQNGTQIELTSVGNWMSDGSGVFQRTQNGRPLYRLKKND